MAIEIVDLPIENGWIFHSYVNVYQRVGIIYKFHEAMKMWKWSASGVVDGFMCLF